MECWQSVHRSINMRQSPDFKEKMSVCVGTPLGVKDIAKTYWHCKCAAHIPGYSETLRPSVFLTVTQLGGEQHWSECGRVARVSTGLWSDELEELTADYSSSGPLRAFSGVCADKASALICFGCRVTFMRPKLVSFSLSVFASKRLRLAKCGAAEK